MSLTDNLKEIFPYLSAEELNAVSIEVVQSAARQALGLLSRRLSPVCHPDRLSAFQDEVWASMGKYSAKLGWGLTGIQGECWACLDAAVDELAVRRNFDDRLRRVMARLKCECMYGDCDEHGACSRHDVEFVERFLNGTLRWVDLIPGPEVG